MVRKSEKTEKTATPPQPEPETGSQTPEQQAVQPASVRAAWDRPDFQSVDTAMEVTAYAGRD
ncbi:pyrroloquinoline quinone precursor peptide PqqA [Streptacidiphilus pinicola]|uniref:pyrroloquinoline quinone precursor peptide PqqA n=1 Tax=Streptacidiphilus pinicola TaxID=2219663 RepID=UPI001401DF6D|nr:pyrroloquinoline quinone precursor peptide PqqA [Streptacidiphilus pinicola]